MSDRDLITVDEERAKAAERLLERKRMGLESAVEALEAVGYRVCLREDGTYAVRPPYVRLAPSTNEQKQDGPKASLADLADYPHALTPVDIAEITGIHVNTIRRLCKEQRIPAGKVGGRYRILKSEFVELLNSTGGTLE